MKSTALQRVRFVPQAATTSIRRLFCLTARSPVPALMWVVVVYPIRVRASWPSTRL